MLVTGRSRRDGIQGQNLTQRLTGSLQRGYFSRPVTSSSALRSASMGGVKGINIEEHGIPRGGGTPNMPRRGGSRPATQQSPVRVKKMGTGVVYGRVGSDAMATMGPFEAGFMDDSGGESPYLSISIHIYLYLSISIILSPLFPCGPFKVARSWQSRVQ